MTFSRRTLAALAAVALLGLGATNAQAALFIDFGGAPVGTITVNAPPGNNINTATNITVPTTFTVTTIAPGDQSGLALGGTFTVNPGTWSLVSPPGVTTLTKSWTGTAGTFTTTLNTLTVNRSVSNSLTLNYSGTLNGPGIPAGGQADFFQVAFTQAGGPGAGISATVTETSFSTVVPEPSSMAISTLGALGLIGYGLRRRKAKVA
jgi:hypothetical protein